MVFIDSLRLGRKIFLWIGNKALATTRRAEVIVRALVRRVMRRGSGVDRHATHRIDDRATRCHGSFGRAARCA